MSKLKSIYLIFEIIICAMTQTTYAHYTGFQNSQSQQYIYIDSDDIVLNSSQKEGVFSGNVIGYFNDIVLKTSNIRVLYKDNDNYSTIDKIVMPSKITAIQKDTDNIIIADHAEYDLQNSQLILTGNINLMYNNRIFKTNKFIYYTKSSN